MSRSVTRCITGLVSKIYSCQLWRVACLWSGKGVKSGVDLYPHEANWCKIRCGHRQVESAEDGKTKKQKKTKNKSADAAIGFISLLLWWQPVSRWPIRRQHPGQLRIHFKRGHNRLHTGPWSVVLTKAVRCWFMLFFSLENLHSDPAAAAEAATASTPSTSVPSRGLQGSWELKKVHGWQEVAWLLVWFIG